MNMRCNTCDGIYDTVDIRFTKKCDNKCAFCIEQFSGIEGKPTDVDAIFNSVIESGTDEVLILGGEPFLEIEKLQTLVAKLYEKCIKIYITTSLPSVIKTRPALFIDIMERITGLNISIQHQNWIRNNDIYNASDPHDRIQLTEKIISQFPSKVRICLNLVKGSIDNKSKLLLAINTFYNMGLRHMKINELSASDDFISFEKIMDVKMKSPYAHGCSTKVLEKEYPTMNIILKRSCFVVEHTLNATLPDLFKAMRKRFSKPVGNKFCVVYEDGAVYKNWITK